MTSPAKARPYDPDELKQCSSCEQWKAKREFYANARRSDGVQTWCKVCQRQRGTWAQRKKNRNHPVTRARKPWFVAVAKLIEEHPERFEALLAEAHMEWDWETEKAPEGV